MHNAFWICCFFICTCTCTCAAHLAGPFVCLFCAGDNFSPAGCLPCTSVYMVQPAWWVLSSVICIIFPGWLLTMYLYVHGTTSSGVFCHLYFVLFSFWTYAILLVWCAGGTGPTGATIDHRCSAGAEVFSQHFFIFMLLLCIYT